MGENHPGKRWDKDCGVSGTLGRKRSKTNRRNAMCFIDHGGKNDIKKRLAYAGTIKDFATTYHVDGKKGWDDGAWKDGWYWNTSDDVILVEVWVHPQETEVNIHPSRHPFFWVENDPLQQKAWDAVANYEWVDVMKNPPSAGPSSPLRAPNIALPGNPAWATASNVIGYTRYEAIALDPKRRPQDNDAQIRGPGKQLHWFPSVYYKDGHLTVEHKSSTNTGWHRFREPMLSNPRERWSLKFFGNVLKTHAEKKDPPVPCPGTPPRNPPRPKPTPT
jgi:hypothetical protein